MQAPLLLALPFLAALAARADIALFRDQVRPLLENNCFQCHGPEKQKGRLRLDSRAAILKGGETGPAVVPGAAAKSLLPQAVRHATKDLAMPPKEKLADKEIAALDAWVNNGAPWPELVAVLFEDEPAFLAALSSGNGRARLVTDDVFKGQAALGITPLQRDNPKISGWNSAIREQPQPRLRPARLRARPEETRRRLHRPPRIPFAKSGGATAAISGRSRSPSAPPSPHSSFAIRHSIDSFLLALRRGCTLASAMAFP